MSTYRPNQELKNHLQKTSESIKDLKLDPALNKAVDTILKTLGDSIKNPDQVNVTDFVKDAIQLFERMGEFDSQFLIDQFEELKPHKKGKKVQVQEYLNEKAASVSPQILALVQAGTSASQSSRDMSGSSDESPEFSLELSSRVLSGDMTAISGLAMKMLESDSGGAIGGKHTVGGHMLSIVADLSPDELVDMLRGILERGIQDIGDIIVIMKILGELGLSIPPDLLQKIADALSDFIAEAATKMSATEFMSMVQEIQAVTNDASSDLFDDSDLSSLLATQVLGGELTSQDSQMIKMLGLDTGLIEGAEQSEDDLLVISDMLKGKLDIKMSGNAEAMAGQQSKEKSGFASIPSPSLLKTEEKDGSNLLSKDAIKPISKLIGDDVAKLIKKELSSFSDKLLTTLDQFYEKQLEQRLDNLF